MGTYLNPGNEVFRRVTSADIYVDKSGLLTLTNKMINSANNYICMSRPRRFGKTIAGNMIAAYYSKGCDSKEIFDRLKISDDPDYEKYLNKYNVIKIDLNSEYQNIKDKNALIGSIQNKVTGELIKEYPDVDFSEKDSLGEALIKVYDSTKDTFIILIDEYDVLVREQVSQALFDEFLSFLNGLFKSDTLRPAISLAYITGILPVVKEDSPNGESLNRSKPRGSHDQRSWAEKEVTSGKGFADVVYIPYVPDMPALVIELKHNKCADSAFSQIKDKKYFDSLNHYTGDLLLVGINYDEKTKEHECRIERFKKD